MGVKFGLTDIDNIYLGSTEISSVYLGETEVYPEKIVLLDADNGIDLINNQFTKIRLDEWGGTDGSVSKSGGAYVFSAPSASEYHASGSDFLPTILANGDINLKKYKYLKVVHQVSSIRSGQWSMGVKNYIASQGARDYYQNIFNLGSTFAKRTNIYSLPTIPTPFYFGITCRGHFNGGTSATLYYMELTNRNE